MLMTCNNWIGGLAVSDGALQEQVVTLALCLSLAYCSARTCLLAIPLVSCPTVGAACLLVSLFRFLSSLFCISGQQLSRSFLVQEISQF